MSTDPSRGIKTVDHRVTNGDIMMVIRGEDGKKLPTVEEARPAADQKLRDAEIALTVAYERQRKSYDVQAAAMADHADAKANTEQCRRDLDSARVALARLHGFEPRTIGELDANEEG